MTSVFNDNNRSKNNSIGSVWTFCIKIYSAFYYIVMSCMILEGKVQEIGCTLKKNLSDELLAFPSLSRTRHANTSKLCTKSTEFT